MPDGFCISEQFFPIAPGADFEDRLQEGLLDANVAETCEATEGRVQCIIETNRFCLTPLSADKTTAEEMFRLSTSDALQEETLLLDTDETSQIRFVYAVPSQTYHFLRRTLPEIEFHLDAHELHLTHAMQQGLYVKADKEAISLLAYRDGQLQLCNRVATQGENNQSYFILTTWSQLGFDPLNDTLHLESDNTKLRETLNTYIKCVS